MTSAEGHMPPPDESYIHRAPETHYRASEGLGLWEPKRTLTLEAARQHSQRVKQLRQGLIGAAAFLLLVLLWQFATQQSTFIVEDDPDESVKMINPRYSGRTKDGLPYALIAETAVRTTQNADAVDLTVPVLEFYRIPDVAPSIVEADNGTYDSVLQVLNLTDAVDLKTDDGYHCISTHARIFAADKRIDGNAPIACDGSFGTVEGQTYTILEDYSKFIFDGGMTGSFEPVSTDQGGETANVNSAATGNTATGFGGTGPIDIKADKATYLGELTILEGNVDVRQGDAQILCDKMDLYRDVTDSQETGSVKLGDVRRIEAVGNFQYISPDNTVIGAQGIYTAETDSIIITDNVTVTQPTGNVAYSEKLTYNVKTKAIRFGEDNCTGGQCGGRQAIQFQVTPKN